MADNTGRSKRSRIYYFDYLRLFVILLVIVLHALLPHVDGFEWYVNEPQTNGLFALLSLFIDVFIMPTMFFLAGYFTYSSLKKRGAKLFVFNKFKRIGLPYLIGILFFVPIITYASALARGGAPGFVSYWTTIYFQGDVHTAHYWFLGMLFAFFLSFVVVYRFGRDRIDRMYERQRSPLTAPKASVATFLFLLLGTALFFVVSLFSVDGRWVYALGVFNVQPTRATGYVLYYYLGIFAYLNQLHLPKRALDKTPLFAAGMVVLAAVYLVFKVTFYTAIADSVPLKFVNSALHVTLCFAVFVTLLLVFKKHLSHSSPVLNRLARTSYSIYYFHLVVVVVLQYYLLSMSLSPYAKAAIVFAVAFVVSYLLSEAYLKALQVAKRPVRRTFLSRAAQQGDEIDSLSED